MAGYWPRSFLGCLRTSTASRSVTRKKALSQYPAMLTSQSVNNPWCLGHEANWRVNVEHEFWACAEAANAFLTREHYLAQNIDSCVCRSRLTFFTVQHPSTIWSCIKHRDFFHGTWFTNWFHLIAVVLSASSVEHLSISEFLAVLNYKVLQLFTYPSLDNRYCEKVLKSALFLMFARKQRTNRNVSN